MEVEEVPNLAETVEAMKREAPFVEELIVRRCNDHCRAPDLISTPKFTSPLYSLRVVMIPDLGCRVESVRRRSEEVGSEWGGRWVCPSSASPSSSGSSSGSATRLSPSDCTSRAASESFLRKQPI